MHPDEIHLATHTIPSADRIFQTSQEAAVRQASNFVACAEHHLAYMGETATAVAATRERGCTHHYHWWHLTVHAVVGMVSAMDGLGCRPWHGAGAMRTENPGRDSRLTLGAAETAARVPSGYSSSSTQQTVPGPWSLVGAARCRALLAIRVNLAAAHKIGAFSRGTSRLGWEKRRREGLARAVECMTDAIGVADTAHSELYIERGGLLAMVGADTEEGTTAASDFATALSLDRRLRNAVSSST